MDVMALARAEREDLLDLLLTLTPEQWRAPSLCAGWTVRDVVAHVLSYEELGPRSAADGRGRTSRDRRGADRTRPGADRPTSRSLSRAAGQSGRTAAVTEREPPAQVGSSAILPPAPPVTTTRTSSAEAATRRSPAA